MKNLTLFVLLFLPFLGCFTGCSDDDPVGGNIKIEFLIDELDINMNIANNPAITCVVNSETGLKSVSMSILKTGDVEEPFKNTITSFFNDKSYSIHEKPVYQEDMTGFKVVAIDLGGNKEEKILPFIIQPVLDAPTINFRDDEVIIREGDESPEIIIDFSALSDLKYVTITKVVDRKEIPLVDTIKAFTNPRQYTFTTKDYDYITFGPGTTGIKAQAVDQYDKVKIALLPVTYIELPAPTVTFEGANPLIVDELTSGKISGNIASGSGLRNISFYLVGPNSTDTLMLEEKSLTGDPKSHDFSINYSDIRVNINGFMVKAQDALDKISKITLPITVNEIYPAPIITATPDNFDAIDINEIINISGSVTSSAGMTSLVINKINNLGEASLIKEYDVTGNKKFVELLNNVTATTDLSKIQILATDINGKITEKIINGTVGYYLLEKIEFGAEKKPLIDPGTFFSVPLRTAMTIDKAYTQQDNMDFSFYVTGNPAGIIRICGISATDLSNSKYVNIMSNGINVGVNGWTKKNATKLQKTTATDFDPANFNSYTIDYIKSFSYAGSTMADLTASNANESVNPNNYIIWFQTVDHGNGPKKGIIKYEGLSPNSTSKVKDSNCIFYLTIKIEK